MSMRHKRNLILGSIAFILAGVSGRIQAASILAPGDVVLVTLNASVPDGFDAVPLVPLEEGTVVCFTDNAWSNTAWRSTEGVITYTATGTVAAGTILSYRGSDTNGFTKSGSFQLSMAGDTLLVYQGPATNPAFIFGAGWAINSPWIPSGDPGTDKSYVPEPLSDETGTLLSLGPRDNYQYHSFTAGTRAEFLQWMSVNGNWTNRDAVGYDAFTPAFMLLLDDLGNPTNLTATAGNRVVDLSWTANMTTDAVMLAFNTTPVFGIPTTTYSASNEIIGGGTVLYNGSNVAFHHASLTNGQTYYYKAWSVRNGTNYSSGVAASAAPYVPPLAAPIVQEASDIQTNQFIAHWSAVAEATGYLLDVATNNAFHDASLPEGTSELIPGEVVLVTVNSSAPKGFDMIPLVNLATGTTVKITDCAWTNTGWRNTEGVVTYTAPAFVTAGTVLSYRGSDENGFALSSGTFDLSGSGETLIAYQGQAANPNFLYGAGWAIAVPWITSGVPSSTQSYIPPGLNAQAGTIISLGTAVNYQYQPSFGTTGTINELLSLVGGTNHWTNTTTPGFSIFASSLTVTGAWRNDFVPGYKGFASAETNASVTGLVSAAIYYYRVRAMNADTVSVYSAFTNVLTLAPEIPALNYTNWALAHGMDPGGPLGQPDQNYDGDMANNWEEFLADTAPMNPLIFYPEVITRFTGEPIVMIYTGPPTTNSRRYDLWVMTNILDEAWTCLGHERTGADDGGEIGFEMTNALPHGFYRIGVKLPP